MHYMVVQGQRLPASEAPHVLLREDSWNDWWTYETLYSVTVRDASGALHDIGTTKVGQFNWQAGQKRPRIDSRFRSLDEANFFSLGQDASYYESLRDLPEGLGAQVLADLCDVVARPDLFSRAANEEVMRQSLLRSVSRSTVRGQFWRVLTGGLPLTEYSFKFQPPAFAAHLDEGEGSDLAALVEDLGGS